MMKCLIFVSLLIHSTFAQKPQPAEPVQPPPKKWLTLNGAQPAVIARGGFSGLFPESSQSANTLALSTSLSDVTLFCSLQLTKDGVGLCLTDIRLDNSTTISTVFPKDKKTYKVNGLDLQGWFAIDYTAETLFNNVSLVQNIYSRPSVFDGQMPISAVEDVTGVKPAKFWLSVQYDAFYTENKLSVALYLQEAMRSNIINYISSPEIGFLKNIGGQVNKARTKLIFEFKDPEALEPTTNQKYGVLLQNLANVKQFASGIVVPKQYIWPVDSNNYLKPATTLVNDAHKQGLEVYATLFANDMPASYNYSYDPSLEYLQFVDNSQFAVDGVVTDFPPTASEAIACFAQQTASPKAGQALIITHNGASGIYPGCTDLAYQQAVNDGADIIDCSVQMSKDEVAFCLDSPDLMASTTAMTSFMSRTARIPEIQNNSGIFSFDLTWSEIQSLKPQIKNPFGNAAGFQRNPVSKNQGKFMTLTEFLEFAKAKAVTGILINIENAAYLASKKGLGIVYTVKTALSNATLDKQSTQKVLIQSDDTSVLSNFQDVPSYKRVLDIQREIGDAPPQPVDEIKKYADAVNVLRPSLVTVSNSFLMSKTNVLNELHAANISVYVSVLRNEYITIAFDYFSDPVVELASFIAGMGVDGVVTEYPATASRYMRSPCSDLNQNLSYTILPAEPGALLGVLPPEVQPPASAPYPALTSADVVDPPLPPVASTPTSNTTGAGPAAAPGSSGVAKAANIALSLLAIIVAALLS